MMEKKINESICSSVGSSILYDMLSCGNEKSKKTLNEINELKEKNKKIMKNEIKEYEIVHHLINERIETMPNILYNFNDSIKNILNFSQNKSSLSNIYDNESCKNIKHKNDFLECSESDRALFHLNYNNIEMHDLNSKNNSKKLIINSSCLLSDDNEYWESKTTSLFTESEMKQNKYNDIAEKMKNIGFDNMCNINSSIINISELNNKIEKDKLSFSFYNKYNIKPEASNISFENLISLSKNDRNRLQKFDKLKEIKSDNIKKDIIEKEKINLLNLKKQNEKYINEIISDINNINQSRCSLFENINNDKISSKKNIQNLLLNDVKKDKNNLNKYNEQNKLSFCSEHKHNIIGHDIRIYSQYFSKCKSEQNEKDEKSRQKISRTVNIPINVMKQGKETVVEFNFNNISNNNLENINYTIVDRCSYITQKLNNPKKIVLKFSKLYIGNDENNMENLHVLSQKIKNYEKIYACFCIPIGYENVRISKKGKRCFSLTSDIFKEKCESCENGKRQMGKMNQSNCEQIKYRHLTEIDKSKKNIKKGNRIYHSFYVESKKINKDCIDFFYEIYFSVNKEILKNIEYGSILVCGENISNIKNSNIYESILNEKNKNVDLFEYPFSLPNNCEILGFSKIPVAHISNAKIRIKEMSMNNSDLENIYKKCVFLFYTYLNMFEIKNNIQNCLTNCIFEKTENKDACVEDTNKECFKSDNDKNVNYNKLNISNINNNYEKKDKQSGNCNNILSDSITEKVKKTDIHTNVILQKYEIKEKENDRIIAKDEINMEILNNIENEIVNKDNLKENINNNKKEDEEILYIYIDKIVNLSNFSFGNLSICIRLYKDEKYFYKNFSIDTEKKMCILLFSKRKLINISEIIFEIWNNLSKKEKNILEPEEIGECLGIIKTDVKDLKNNKNITYIEKNLDLSYIFYNDNINFMFRIMIVKELKNMYENVMNFCINYFENNYTNVDNDKTNCLTPLKLKDYSFCLNKHSENLKKTNDVNNFDIYEINREILRRDIHGNEIIDSILKKNKTFENNSKLENKKKESESIYPLKNNEKIDDNKDIDYFSNLKNDEKNLNNDKMVIDNDENGKNIYINKICLKNELFLFGMNEKIVNMIIDDIENNNYFINENNSKYILKNNFEEYIYKIHNKWEKLSNKLFLKNNKNMMLNDVCEYLDSLYIDDDNYLSKKDFFLFFQQVGIIFVDTLIFDELCLLFFDKKKGKIEFSLFSLLIIKKGIIETKNLLYGYNILVRFFDFLKVNNITIEYLENEIFKIMLQNNYYSERIRKYMSTIIMTIPPNIQNKRPNEKLSIFLKDKDNICSCTSLLFLHSIQFILNKYNNQNFSSFELFFLVKYIMHSQYKYILPDMHVFINEIKGIEKVNITFFLCLYYIYTYQSRDVEPESISEFDKCGHNNYHNGNDNCISDSEIKKQFDFWKEEQVLFTDKDNTLNVSYGNENENENNHINNHINNLGNDKAENISDNPVLTLSMLESKQNDYKIIGEYSSIINNNDLYCKLIDNSSKNELKNKKEKDSEQMYRIHNIGFVNPELEFSQNKSNNNEYKHNNLKYKNDYETKDIDLTQKWKDDDEESNIMQVYKGEFVRNTKNKISKKKIEKIYEKITNRKDIKNGITNCLIILYSRIVSEIVNVEYVAKCLQNYYEQSNRDEIKKKFGILFMLDQLGIYTSIDIGINLLRWYEKEINIFENKNIFNYNNRLKKINKSISIKNYNINKHISIINKIITKYCENQNIVGNIFSGSVLESFFKILKERNLNIQIFSKNPIFSYTDFYKQIKKLNLDFSKNYIPLLFCNLLSYDLSTFYSINNKLIFFDSIQHNWNSWNKIHFEFCYVIDNNLFDKLDCDKKNNFDGILQNVKHKRKELNMHYKEEEKCEQIKDISHYDVNKISNNNQSPIKDCSISFYKNKNKRSISVVKKFIKYDYFFLPLYSIFFYFSNNEYLFGEELIKIFFLKIFQFEVRYININEYRNKYYTFYDFLELLKEKNLLSNYHQNDDIFFRKDFLKLIILVNRMCLNKKKKFSIKNVKTDCESKENDINFDEIIQKNINTFSSNFKKSLNAIKKNIYKLKADFPDDSTSLFDVYNEIFYTCRAIKINTNYKNEDSDSSIILTNNKEDILENRNKLLLSYFIKSKYIIKYIREYFYLFVLCDKIMSHNKTKNNNVHTKVENKNLIKLSFNNSDFIIYQKKLKFCQLEKMKTKMYPKTMKQINKLYNKKMEGYKNYENHYSNIKIIDFPFLYEEVFICHKEKQFEKEEYAYMVYPYILLFCDFLKRIISIYKKKNVYSNYIRKLFHFNNYEKPNKKFYFMHNVENIMTRSGSFDLKEWNKIYTIFEMLDIKIDDFFLNLCNILEQNNYIITLFNDIIIFNYSESTLFDIVSFCTNNKSHHVINLHECDNELAIEFEKNENKIPLKDQKKKKMDIFIKNTMYYMSFNKLILNDLDENDQEHMHRHIIKNKSYVNYMAHMYIRMLFNECISSGLNINKLFQNIKTRNSFINILSKHFNRIFSKFDIDIFTKKYSYVFDMTSIHLSLYNNFIFYKDFLKDMYKQGDYYTSYLKNKLLNFFLKNKHIFSLKRYKGVEIREENEISNNDNIIKIRKQEADYLIPSIDLKNILACHGVFLSWAELYDFFHPLNKYCVIHENEEKKKNILNTENYKDSIDNLRNDENLNPYILKAYINFSNLLIIAEKICIQEIKIENYFSSNCNNQLIDIYSDNEEALLYDQSIYIVDKKRKSLEKIKDNIFQGNVLDKDGYVNIKNKEEKGLNISNDELNIKKENKKRKSIEIKYDKKNEIRNKMVMYKKESVLKIKRKFTNLEYNIGNSENNGYYYNISFNVLTLERVLYLLFIKVSNLLIKKNLKYEQIYFGIKNVKEKDIKKKEMKNACSLLLNLNGEELENMIPDDFILWEQDFKKGVFINIHILKEEYDNLFLKCDKKKKSKKKNKLEIHVDEFISFFEKKSINVKFSNYNFFYNFSYEWINFMNIKNEYVKGIDCDELIMKFSTFEKTDKIFENFQKNKSNILLTKLDNPSIISKFDKIHSKEKIIELFEKNIKEIKWKKILIPVFEANTFYVHTFRIILREFTGIRKFAKNIELEYNNLINNKNGEEYKENMNNSIDNDNFKLSYLCCFGMNEIVIDNLFNKNNYEKRNNVFFLNYLFEHKFSTINEMDIINLFEKNKNILKLKLLYKNKIISEATLHILELFSVIKNKKKNENKTLCFISNNRNNKDILFLDLDIYYEIKIESSSKSVKFDTFHGKINKKYKNDIIAIENENNNIINPRFLTLKKSEKQITNQEIKLSTCILKKENDLVNIEKTIKKNSDKNKKNDIFNYSWEYVLMKNGKCVSSLRNVNLKNNKNEENYQNENNVDDSIKLKKYENNSKHPNFVNISITDLIIPINFIKFVKNKFYESKEKEKGKNEDVFISIYVQIYKKNENEEYKLVSLSAPSIINNSTCLKNKKLINLENENENKNKNNILDKTSCSEKDSQKTEKCLPFSKEIKSIKKKGKKFKINIMNEYLNICNIQIKHNEIIEIFNLYIEGKIVIRALISYNYYSEDIILGEHYFKIKNIIHENKDIYYCAERLFYPIFESNFISNLNENDKEISILHKNVIDNDFINNQDVCTCINQNKCKENKDLKICESCSKNIMGYISYQYEMRKDNTFKERKKRTKLAIPNFVKMYFTNGNDENNYIDEIHDDIFMNTIYERMFRDVIKNVKYKKFVNLEIFINSLEKCRYSNYIEYFKQYFSNFINYNNSLYFSLKSVLLILAIKELSCNFFNFLQFFSHEINKYVFNVSEIGIVQSAYFINCVLKSQNQVTKIKEYENKISKKQEKNENLCANKYDNIIGESFSSDIYVSSDLSSSSFVEINQEKKELNENNLTKYKKEIEIKKKKEKIGLNENNWCIIHNWKKWLVQYEKKKKKFFFLYLFLNDIISFYEENKNEKKKKQRHFFSLMYDNCINVIKKSPIFKKDDTSKLVSQNIINNKKDDVKTKNENILNTSGNNTVMEALFNEIKIKDEMQTRNISKDDVNVKNINKFPYFFNIQNENKIETDIKMNANIKARNDMNKLFCENKTSLYKYNNIKNYDRNKWDVFREQINNKSLAKYETKCKLVKNVSNYINNDDNEVGKNFDILKCANSDSKYKIYLKIKRIKHSFPLINNKKINIFLSFQIVLNNYKLLKKNGVFPYFLNNEENNYIINKIQEKSSIFFCDNYFAFKCSSILLLPSINELRSIFTKNNDEAYLYDLKFYLKNFSIQICFYKADENASNILNSDFSDNNHSIQNNIYNASKYLKNKQNKIDLINNQINQLGKYKNVLETTYGQAASNKELLIAKSVIPLSILLKKKKTKVHVPLIFSPFVTPHVNKNEIEVILKYETRNEKKYDEKEYLCYFNSTDNYSRKYHNLSNSLNTIQEMDSNHFCDIPYMHKLKKTKVNLTKDRKFAISKNYIYDEGSNISLMFVPKVPPPIS
ncbi:conserved Plasmodium protein, unknown function [Plasmodium berghei]|uniref:Uncharacterized protein n=1 Tax=Plasmodium berghei TaxID=5821 RepID=A0A1D3SBG5_PLABE|nr:conserved Plasmodium protein, unknown function [Plasmodium berghei]